jgi:hypothetical protein
MASEKERIPAENNYVGFEVLTAVVMKTVTFWVIAPCSPYEPTFRRNASPQIFRVENQPSKKPARAGGVSA